MYGIRIVYRRNTVRHQPVRTAAELMIYQRDADLVEWFIGPKSIFVRKKWAIQAIEEGRVGGLMKIIPSKADPEGLCAAILLAYDAMQS